MPETVTPVSLRFLVWRGSRHPSYSGRVYRDAVRSFGIIRQSCVGRKVVGRIATCYRLSTVTWRVETLSVTVDGELDALPAKMRGRFAPIGELIAAVGLGRVGARHVLHLTGPLSEMRFRGRDGTARALYVTARDRRVVVVRVFVKTLRIRGERSRWTLRRAGEVSK